MKQVKKAAKDQKIMVILCHEWSRDTEKALPGMIEYLEGEGYIFLPLFYDSQMVNK
jgi:peptidoglycan/xylan/chitin deacetylase (PgdA/CDA1 family)